MTKNVLNRLSSKGKPPGPPIELYETGWKRYVNVAKYVDNGMPVYCTRCWKFIDLETLQLSVNNITKRISSIGSYIGTNAFGNYRVAPNLAFVPSSENLFENKGAVKLIFVTFLVRTNQQTNYPVDISFYWNSAHREWLPREFVIGHVTPVNPLFLLIHEIGKLEAVDYQRGGRIVAGRCSDEGGGFPVELSRLFSTGRGSLVSADQRADGVCDRLRGLDSFLAFEQGMDVASKVDGLITFEQLFSWLSRSGLVLLWSSGLRLL